MLPVWHIVTSEVYHNNIDKVVDIDIYFLLDTHEIYRGREPFNQSVILYSELPTKSIAINRLYINSTTLEGRIYDGENWAIVIKPVDDEITENGSNPVSSKAVIAYINTILQNINDTLADKMSKVNGATPDNIAIFDEDGNVIDSGKGLDDLIPNTHVYYGATLEEATRDVNPVKEDVAVISEPIGETGKVQKKVYQYDGENWVEFDSYYDASKVILPEDWVTTSKIGVIQTLTNGQAIIGHAGDSVMQSLRNMTMKESNPTITQPAVSFVKATSDLFKAYEVGTNVNLSAVSATLSSGTYSFGSKDANGDKRTSTSAGVTASSWNFTDSDDVSKDTGATNTADFGTIQVEDDTSYNVTAKATYGASPYTPITNAGNEYASGKIGAGSKSATTSNITGYRNCFYGALDHKNDLTSDIIRGLTPTNGAVSIGKTFSMAIPVGTLRAVVCYPADIANASTTLGSVLDINGMSAQIASAFDKTVLVDVEGANGYTAKSYRCIYIDFAEPVTEANTYDVTL